jgi:nucleotidyltransferase substrate binding protein (TIGR01987 family)
MTDVIKPELPEVDLTPFMRALEQLELAVKARSANPADAFIRDAVIQRFEFTYELSIKMLRRYMRSIAASNNEVDELTFRELLRRAGELRLLQGDVLNWLDFRQARTDTVHTYNESRAIEVAATAAGFAVEARVLLERLQERINV